MSFAQLKSKWHNKWGYIIVDNLLIVIAKD